MFTSPEFTNVAILGHCGKMFTSLEITNDSYHSDLQSAYISPIIVGH